MKRSTQRLTDNLPTRAPEGNKPKDTSTEWVAAEMLEFFDRAPIGIYIIQDRKFKFTNAKFREESGYSQDELAGADPLSLAYPEDREMVRENAVKMLKGELSSPYEYRFVSRNGEIEWVMETVASMLYQGRRAAFGYLMDITKNKQLEQLKESKAMLAEAERVAHIGSWQLDLVSNVLNWSDEVYRICRLEPQQFVATYEAFLDNIHPDDREMVNRAYAESVRNKTPYSIVHRLLPKDGAIKYVEERCETFYSADGQPLRSVGTIQDVTERRRAEAKLEQAAQEWQATFDTFSDLVSVVDNGHKILKVNRAFAEFFEMKPEEVIGQACYEVAHGLNKPCPNCAFKKALETRKSSTVEFFEPHLQLYLQVSASLMFDDKGDVIGCVHEMKDITERKNMDAQLMVTNRLASLGELASGIAHELNNPLTSIIGFSELLLERDIPDDIKEDVRIINKEAQRTAQIVRHLLTFARKHSPAKQQVDINSIIGNVLELRAYEEKVSNIQVITHLAPDLPLVMADGFQLQQVFMNLIINAEYFMTEAHGRGILTIVTERAGDIIRASFADDGPGITRENLGHIFNPFFTTKEVGKGTGLGLSICYGIITEHGGRIYAESEPGKGAAFILELPIRQ